MAISEADPHGRLRKQRRGSGRQCFFSRRAANRRADDCLPSLASCSVRLAEYRIVRSAGGDVRRNTIGRQREVGLYGGSEYLSAGGGNLPELFGGKCGAHPSMRGRECTKARLSESQWREAGCCRDASGLRLSGNDPNRFPLRDFGNGMRKAQESNHNKESDDQEGGHVSPLSPQRAHKRKEVHGALQPCTPGKSLKTRRCRDVGLWEGAAQGTDTVSRQPLSGIIFPSVPLLPLPRGRGPAWSETLGSLFPVLAG